MLTLGIPTGRSFSNNRNNCFVKDLTVWNLAGQYDCILDIRSMMCTVADLVSLDFKVASQAANSAGCRRHLLWEPKWSRYCLPPEVQFARQHRLPMKSWITQWHYPAGPDGISLLLLRSNTLPRTPSRGLPRPCTVCTFSQVPGNSSFACTIISLSLELSRGVICGGRGWANAHPRFSRGPKLPPQRALCRP